MSIFDNVSFPRHKRNIFNLSHDVNTSAAFGQLVPFICEEVLPGDTFQISTQLFARAMPMFAPLMHKVNIYTHFFFVPNRLVWDNWKDFITGGEDGTAEPVFPKISIGSEFARAGSLADHLGVGRALAGDSNSAQLVNALPFRAYALIWNEYYRDQNLQEELEISKEDGIDTITNREILLRNWQKDYFTSSLPWTQRGPISTLPIESVSDVYMNANTNGGLFAGNVPLDRSLPLGVDSRSRLVTLSQSLSYSEGSFDVMGEVGSGIENPNPTTEKIGEVEVPIASGINNEPSGTLKYNPNGTLSVNVDASFDINELRRSIALQRWLEANARGGARYIEQIYSHFGVVSSDARLQRPEFLGGGRQPLTISEVLQTSASTADSDLGDMAGHGISAAKTKQFRRYFEEHGFIIGIMSIMPKTSYMQGTRRFFGKFDKFDYAFPEFANLGEQSVFNSEIYNGFQNGINEESGTFGYQSRYCEYKYIPSSVHGALKTEAFEPWTLVRKFAVPPVLNSEFIDVDYKEEDLGRIFPVKDEDTQFIIQLWNDIKAVRILPKHVIPSI